MELVSTKWSRCERTERKKRGKGVLDATLEGAKSDVNPVRLR